MRWQEFELQQSRLAALGRRCLGDPGVVLVGTIRRDGSPRLSPVEPLFWRFVGVEGGVVSGHAPVDIVVLVCAEWLPAES